MPWWLILLAAWLSTPLLLPGIWAACKLDDRKAARRADKAAKLVVHEATRITMGAAYSHERGTT